MSQIVLDKTIQGVCVFYDGECGMCCGFVSWLEKQKRGCELECVDFHSEVALERFPDLWDYEPEKEMVVLVNRKKVYQGGEGWVHCLWTCKKYQWLARRMSGKLFLPLAKKMCYLVSKNRLGISRLFFRKTKDAETKDANSGGFT